MRERVGDRGKQRVADSTSHHLLPLSSKFTPQYLFCDNGQNSFKHLSFTVNTMLLFLSRGRLRDTSGGRGSSEVAGCCSTGGQQNSPQPQTQNMPSLNDLEASTWPGNNLLAAPHIETSSPNSSPVPWAPTSSVCTCQELLIDCSPPALQKFASCWPRGCRPARAFLRYTVG